jgi:DNA-binding PadR family transcriptional regulator
MSLPHVILGLLHREPATGYALARRLRDEIDPAWAAGFSQIYPALAGLRRRGWVVQRVLGPGRGPRRLLYRATASGRRELARWLAQIPAAARRNDPDLVRIALLDTLAPAARRQMLAALAAALEAETSRIESLPPADGSRGLARAAVVHARRALLHFLEIAAGRRASPRTRLDSSQKPARATFRGARRTYDR